MAPTAVLFSRLRPPSLTGRPSSSRTAYLPTERQRLSAFLTLMKPRVMLLAVFTALVGLMIAPGHLDPLLASVAVLAIAAGAGAAGVLNMWYDADIDGVMTRTAMRPIPRASEAPPALCHPGSAGQGQQETSGLRQSFYS